MLPGGQLMTTTDVENYPGFPEGISGPKLMDLFHKQAARFGARLEQKTVDSVDFSGQPLVVHTGEEVRQARSVIIATGASAQWLGLPSEKRFANFGVSACATCDGALPRFRNKPIVVVGGGDTAMEETIFLTKFAKMVHVVHRRDKFRASKIMADRVVKHEKVKVEWNSVLDEVIGNDDTGVTGARLKDVHTGDVREVECTGVFIAIGHKPNSDLFKGILDMDDVGYIVTRPNSSHTNVSGVFAAGDVQDKVYRQAITAAGSGCMAAIDCTRWLEAQEMPA
jgi:thioredoxin reductase (NADPH)